MPRSAPHPYLPAKNLESCLLVPEMVMPGRVVTWAEARQMTAERLASTSQPSYVEVLGACRNGFDDIIGDRASATAKTAAECRRACSAQSRCASASWHESGAVQFKTRNAQCWLSTTCRQSDCCRDKFTTYISARAIPADQRARVEKASIQMRMALTNIAGTDSAAALRAAFALSPLARMQNCLPQTADSAWRGMPVVIVAVGAREEWLTRASQHLSAFSLCEAQAVSRAGNLTAYNTVYDVQLAIRSSGVKVLDPCLLPSEQAAAAKASNGTSTCGKNNDRLLTKKKGHWGCGRASMGETQNNPREPVPVPVLTTDLPVTACC